MQVLQAIRRHLLKNHTVYQESKRHSYCQRFNLVEIQRFSRILKALIRFNPAHKKVSERLQIYTLPKVFSPIEREAWNTLKESPQQNYIPLR